MPFKYAVKTPSEYVRQIIDKDIHRLDNVKRDRRKVDLLMRSLARNESTVAGVSTLKADIATADGVEVSDETIASYLDALSRLFVIENQTPFAGSMRSGLRLKKAEKRHFCDTRLFWGRKWPRFGSEMASFSLRLRRRAKLKSPRTEWRLPVGQIAIVRGPNLRAGKMRGGVSGAVIRSVAENS